MTADKSTEVPEEFVAQVAGSLKHLYDPPALVRSPLREALTPMLSAEAGARFLRTALLEAIESLNPGPNVPFRSRASRSYDAVRLRYVEGRTIEEVARELAVSERQAYRDVRKGEADVATVLWPRFRDRVVEGQQSAGPSLHQEVERLRLSPASTLLQTVLDGAVAAVMPLAEREGIRLRRGETGNLSVSADASGLRQCLIAMLSYALQCSAGQVTVEARPHGATVHLMVSYHRERKSGSALTKLLATARVLAKALGGELEEAPSGGRSCLTLTLPLGTPATVLVIDDNQGLIELFERYLQDSDCRVLGASDAIEGLRLARECKPQAIVLDILMPGTDGWALLAEMKADPATAEIPVVVCSVFNDPELAKALGASAFIPKPVARAELTRALASLGLP